MAATVPAPAHALNYLRGKRRPIIRSGNEIGMDDRRARQASSRSTARTRDAGNSRRTVLIAIAANAVIAVAKLGGGVISGSSALLAEAAHSVADTTNQVFLLVSITLSGRDPDARRPFGHGRGRCARRAPRRVRRASRCASTSARPATRT
jgi:hypothetical protein